MWRNQLGHVQGVFNEIRMGDRLSCRTLPYRLVPKCIAKTSQVFVRLGILRVSGLHQWYQSESQMGCFCINFRKMNGLTEPDQFLTSTVDEMIDQVECACHIPE